MIVTQVALCPTESSIAAGRPSLTPELLAASGARYSRSNDGLEAILDKIDPENLDKSVDSIFKMIDYGHQSIADMAPVAMFIDGITLWLAYHVWTLVPVAGGQESSTRYIRLAADAMPRAAELGVPPERADEWGRAMERSFAAYHESLAMWESVVDADPDVARIPISLQQDTSPKGVRAVARMRRNYAFDRARYFLPSASRTNMMLIMSARAWVTLCQNLLSGILPEGVRLGEAIRSELELAAPRMLRHATRKESFVQGSLVEFQRLRKSAGDALPAALREGSSSTDHPATPRLDVMLPENIGDGDLRDDLKYHDNRYSWVGSGLQRTVVRFGWDAVTFGEIRDLNRHRTGTKYCPPVPQGFYAAIDQLPSEASADNPRAALLHRLADIGREASATAHAALRNGDPAFVYWTLLGTQYRFEHVTTADKFIYEAEIRTGLGAHYRYAAHLRDALALWYDRFPQTRDLVLEGTAEPE